MPNNRIARGECGEAEARAGTAVVSKHGPEWLDGYANTSAPVDCIHSVLCALDAHLLAPTRLLQVLRRSFLPCQATATQPRSSSRSGTAGHAA